MFTSTHFKFTSNDIKTISIYAGTFLIASACADCAFADSQLMRKSKEFMGEAHTFLQDARPFITATIGVVAGVTVGMYRENMWLGIASAVVGGGLANVLPDLFGA